MAAAAWADTAYGSIPRPTELYGAAAVLDSTLLLAALPVAAVAALLIKDRRFGAEELVLGVVLALAIGVAAKAGIHSPRPYVSLEAPFPPPKDIPSPVYEDDYASFPSLHAAVSFAIAASSRRASKEVFATVLVGSAFVSYTRLFLYQHFVLDVVAGGLLGFGCVLAAGALLQRRGSAPSS